MEPPGQAAAHPEAAGEMSRFRDIGSGPMPVSARTLLNDRHANSLRRSLYRLPK